MAVGQILLEKSVPVADAVSVERHAHGGGGIQKTGGQTAQAAVAQGVIGDLLKGGDIRPVFRHGILHLREDPQIQKIGVDQPPHEKFRREIVGALFAPHGGPCLLDLSAILPHDKFGDEIVLLRHRHAAEFCPLHLRR